MRTPAHFSRPGRLKRWTLWVLGWAQRFFLLMGLLALGSYGFVVARTSLYQAYESWRFDQARQGRPASPMDFPKHWIDSVSTALTEALRPQPPEPRAPARLKRSRWMAPRAGPAEGVTAGGEAPAPVSPPTAPGPARVPTGEVLGRIAIPRLGVSAMILEGDDDEILRLGVGMFPARRYPASPAM